MGARIAASLIAIGRLVLGVGLVAAPESMTAPWIGRAAKRRNAQVVVRAVGARDVAIGGGLVAALAGAGPLQPWLIAGLLADATDLAVTVAERDSLPDVALPLIGAAAGSGIALGAYALTGAGEAGASPSGPST